MAPSRLLWILIKAVLRVVDDEIRARQKLDVTTILGMYGENADPREGPSGRVDQVGGVGLVIDRVDDRH